MPRVAGALVAAGLFWMAYGWALPAYAERTHVVRPGQTLSEIASRYNIDVGALAAANRMGREDMLRDGQVLTVPERGVVYVRPGQTLARIARAHNVSVTALVRQNRLGNGSDLRVGQRLLLPGFEAAAKRRRAARRWGRPERPGVAHFYRYWSGEHLTVRLINRRGRVKPHAVRALRRLLRPKNSRRRKNPDRRLVALLARVSDHFGGRRIDVISGYRVPGGSTKKSSHHVRGEAIDFRIPGVPLKVLRDYCRKLPRVGVGYYPRGRFIHLDVREDDGYWVDVSAPGEPAKIRSERELAAMREAAEEPQADDEAEEAEDTGGNAEEHESQRSLAASE